MIVHQMWSTPLELDISSICMVLQCGQTDGLVRDSARYTEREREKDWNW